MTVPLLDGDVGPAWDVSNINCGGCDVVAEGVETLGEPMDRALGDWWANTGKDGDREWKGAPPRRCEAISSNVF